MTDKERYEAAMEENHKLREELKNWKEAYEVMVKEAHEKSCELATEKDRNRSLLKRNKMLEEVIADKNEELKNLTK